MNESAVMKKIVQIAHNHAKKAGAKRVVKLVLEIGQLSEVIPDTAKKCYPFAISGTMLEQCKLAIEVVPALGVCKQCNNVYNVVEMEFKCPQCENNQCEVLSGHELKIKEILAE